MLRFLILQLKLIFKSNVYFYYNYFQLNYLKISHVNTSQILINIWKRNLSKILYKIFFIPKI